MDEKVIAENSIVSGDSVTPVVPNGMPKPPMGVPKVPVISGGVPKPPVAPVSVPEPAKEAEKAVEEKSGKSVVPPVAAVEGIVTEIPPVAESEPLGEAEEAAPVNSEAEVPIEVPNEEIPGEEVPVPVDAEISAEPVEAFVESAEVVPVQSAAPPIAPPVVDGMESVDPNSALYAIMQREREVAYREQNVIAREQSVVQQEQGIAEYNQNLYERELKLAQDLAELTAYHQSLEEYKNSLEAPLAQANYNLEYLIGVINASGFMVCVLDENGYVQCYNPTEYAMMVNGSVQ